ncbi:Outer membrane receptor proteins, mostly Fe transport [Catalinimonas alkaloidigena]|uniref:Outer membrane receptor proteins, mostly Fe transport n=1 Tax=Catalinimonas alkaloidigena TaxID=1075417 RepID=A0A1G9AXU6_9BACT|nr:TonB-dependent receptor [Catalinimonas alkaloidigena]SDK32043.1 Outer membrane receptor proteins, mostly Fe transport [Catalinimonas alkaloidigena]
MRPHYPLISLLFLVVLAPCSFAQTGKITGMVRDARTQEPLIGVAVVVNGTDQGGVTDVEGYYTLDNLTPKTYNVTAQYVGYRTLTKYDVVVTTGNTLTLNFDLEEAASELGEVVVEASPFQRRTETPNSIQSLSTQEIKAYPGGNNDIAKVVQSLPGVSGSVGFRNDIIIRGGAPNENVYYLDGVEVPNINHFATQGSAGGPVGMLNVSFIDDVTLSTSAFPARYDNPLSGVLQFRQRTGNREKRQGSLRLGASEFAGTLEGPLIRGKENTTFIVSVRRSYLQLLFKLIDLPFLPGYWDYQYKMTHKFENNKDEISLIGLGSIDRFTLNIPEDASLEQQAILDQIPVYRQWTSTVGATWKHRFEDGYFDLTLSGNILNNGADKFEDNDEGNEARRLLKLESVEDENKLRFNWNKFSGPWSWAWGASVQHARYTNQFYQVFSREPLTEARFDSEIRFWKAGAYGQVSRTFFEQRLDVSLGLRSDANTFTASGLNPLSTLSPRLSASFALSDQWRINGSVGRYYKLPPYTVLGFRNNANQLVNQDVRYIRSDHLVAGLEWLPWKSGRFTLEGFWKRYDQYPVSVLDSISLANLGGDFGVLGNEDVRDVGRGRAYGVEFLYQQKLIRNFYGILAYTYYHSEFTGFDRDRYIPSAWDQRHLLSFTGGYKFPRNWEVGARFRAQRGAPYTPYNTVASLLAYPVRGQGLPDYTQINTLRLSGFSALDLRVDKKWNFDRWSLDLYLDIQNALDAENPTAPTFTLERNPDGSVRTRSGQPYQPNQQASDAPGGELDAIPVLLPNSSGARLPTIGLIIEL